jgi:gamma-glutamylcyclotransferase (GGCT)/AIG2-like uncharacterized protein YtfP
VAADYYFAYGSNMNRSRVESRKMDFTHCETGILTNYRLAFNKRSVKYPGAAAANVMQSTGQQVQGIVYHLSDAAQIMAMDPFEGYPHRYNRVLAPIQTANGLLDVWVYIANANHVQEGLRPAVWYLNHLLAGRDYLTPDYVKNLETTSCLPDTEMEPQP